MPNTHTAGPWHIVPYGDGDSLVICLDEAGDKRVAFMAVPGQRDQQERRKTWKRIKANARLIAAAPELLEALKALLREVDETAARVGWADRGERARARSAITKAEAGL